MRAVVLGAGFGGLEVTTRLSEEFGDDIDVVLIDKADGFVFGFSKLDVMFGRHEPAAVHHSYRDVVKPASASYGMCYLEFGHDQVARVDVTFLSGQAPIGDMDGPSEAFARDKVEFGSSRVARWFNPRQ